MSRKLPENFSIEYLASVGVSAMGFAWRVVNHMANNNEMLAMVEANSASVPGMNDSLTSIMDAATSIASTLWHHEPRLRMPTAVARVVSINVATPEVVYIHCIKAQSAVNIADVIIIREDGMVLMEIQGMAFAGVEGGSFSGKSTSGLVHQINWPPAVLTEEPLEFAHIAFLASDTTNTQLETYIRQLDSRAISTSIHQDTTDLPWGIHPSLAVVYLPQVTDQVFDTATIACDGLVAAAQAILRLGSDSLALIVLFSRSILKSGGALSMSKTIPHSPSWQCDTSTMLM